MEHESVTVQIMLGGRSTRMGRDKALVELGGRTLLDRALDRWREYGAGVQLSVGNPERRAMAPEGMPAVTDFYPDRGPLGGSTPAAHLSHPAAAAHRGGLPLPHPRPGGWLLAAIGTGDASVYTLDGRPQPLFGLYRRTCLPEAAGMLAVGENKLRLLLDRVDTVYLPTADPDPFRNLNTPEELERARRSVWL